MLSLKQLYEKGVAYSSNGNYADAIKCYDKILEIDSKDKDVWNAKGTALTNQDNYSEAMRCFDQAILLDPKFTTPWNSKAIAYKNQGCYEEAIQCHEKALLINPSNATAINGIKKIRELMVNTKTIAKNPQAFLNSPSSMKIKSPYPIDTTEESHSKPLSRSPYPLEDDSSNSVKMVKSPYPLEHDSSDTVKTVKSPYPLEKEPELPSNNHFKK